MAWKEERRPKPETVALWKFRIAMLGLAIGIPWMLYYQFLIALYLFRSLYHGG